MAMTINVTYNSNGVLSYYDLSYGGIDLVSYVLSGYTPQAAPKIISSPSDLNVVVGESVTQSIAISWIATDANPNTYTIELQGTGIVDGPRSWSSGATISYNVPIAHRYPKLSIGTFTYIINITDDFGNWVTDECNLIVNPDTSNPVIYITPNDITVQLGYKGITVFWSVQDTNPNTFTIERLGAGIVFGPIEWGNGPSTSYYIAGGLPAGKYTYIANFTDDYGHFTTDSFIFTVLAPPRQPISGYDFFFFLGIITFTLISLILLVKQKRLKTNIF
jgi:hypothetical protein